MDENNNINKGKLLVSQINESTNNPLVIVFSASWHGHSDIIEIISEKIDNANDKINVLALDADSDEDLFIKYNISTIPSALIIKDKNMIKKVEGTFSKKMILDIVEAC